MSCEHEEGHLQAKERDLEQNLPQPSDGTNPANTLVSDFSPQNSKTINFCFLSHPTSGSLFGQP